MNDLTKDERIELLEAHINCISVFLDYLNAPIEGKKGEFSIIGRIDKSIEESFKKGFKYARENPHVKVTRAWRNVSIELKKDYTSE